MSKAQAPAPPIRLEVVFTLHGFFALPNGEQLHESHVPNVEGRHVEFWYRIEGDKPATVEELSAVGQIRDWLKKDLGAVAVDTIADYRVRAPR